MQLDHSIAAIVTGGASGLGAASARALAGAGCKVAVLDLNEAAGAAIAGEIDGLFAPCDVTSEESVDAALAAVREAHGTERVLVNCAGIAIGRRTARRDRDSGACEPHDLASFRRVIEINLIGTFQMIAKSAAAMMALEPVNDDGGRGVIVATSSVAAEDGQLGQVAYAASKGGILSMTLPVARDLARDGIRMVTIMPGLFDTPMFEGLPDDVRASLAKSVPHPSRLGLPAEYAALVRHICENDMLNGEHIRLDGAVRLAAG